MKLIFNGLASTYSSGALGIPVQVYESDGKFAAIGIWTDGEIYVYPMKSADLGDCDPGELCSGGELAAQARVAELLGA